MKKLINLFKRFINLFRKQKPTIIKDNDVLTVTHDNPQIDLSKTHNKMRKEKVVLHRKRYKLNNDNTWTPYTQHKTVNIYGRTRQQLDNEASRKQKLYEMGEL